jgi:hypothetical protein
MATPSKGGRSDPLGYPAHPVDRSTTRLAPLSPSETRYGNLSSPLAHRGLEMLSTQIAASKRAPNVDVLKQRLRELMDFPATPSPLVRSPPAASPTRVVQGAAAAAAALKPVHRALAPLDPPPVDLRRRARSIRDAAELTCLECPAVRGIVAPICAAYEALLAQAMLAAPSLLLDEEAMAAAAASSTEPMVDRATSQSPILSNSKHGSFVSVDSSSPQRLGTFRRNGGSPIQQQLREAESMMFTLSERVEELERENADLQASGSHLREAATSASMRLHIASSALQKTALLDGVAFEEIAGADTPLHEVDGMTLQLVTAAFRRREASLLEQVERLQEMLALRDVALSQAAAEPPAQ